MLRSIALAALILACSSGCGQTAVEDPFAELNRPDALPVRHIAAMDMLEARGVDEAYLEQLEVVLWADGFVVEVREAALERMHSFAPERLQRSIRLRMPNVGAYGWLERLCAIIAERGWDEQTPTLISSWARTAHFVPDWRERPEYEALVALHGEDAVVDVVYETFRDTHSAIRQRLREKCWELMHRLGERERLVALVASTEPPDDDLLFADLHAGAVELGLVPVNREEIVWLRTLRQPEHESFWRAAAEARTKLHEEALAGLELRHLAVIVSAAVHEPELLERSRDDLFRQVASLVGPRRHYAHQSTYAGNPGIRIDGLRGTLSWGDLVTILMAVRAMDVPQVAAHIFHYADRDMADTSTEYGGLIALDHLGRFVVHEHTPRRREHDQKFIPNTKMYEDGYSAVFHFHNHTQKHRNSEYAGPGYGDHMSADNGRMNCLVFTFVDADTINVDYYRHGKVVVDLGTITRVSAG